MKIAITGATGNLGSQVVNKLKERVGAENIIALARTPEKAANLGVEVRAFDYYKPEEMELALVGVDKLLLISGDDIGKRIEQHKNVVNAAIKAKVNAITYTSLLNLDDSSIGFAPEHVETEKEIKKSGIPYTFLRNGWYTENYLASLPTVLELGAVYGSAGSGKITSATRADLAEAAAIVLSLDAQEGKTYELSGEEVFTMNDYAAEIARQTGKDISYVNLQEEDYASALEKAGLPEGLAKIIAGADTATSKGDLYYAGNELAELLGRPTVTLKEAIANTLAK
ncbi:SDR family oxidoreductase [Cellulophaga sp. 20_2_10]|uniref:SDR family oxidoreductase n=1 Tax=Cellulophaga sp. 20_2_10 TaxID=2942476 RepID=UPI00201B00B2|nr:SDR family oxidoreductase [Cellulophaga sp. 20_2_10]MCL5246223.1 SDR family oxidoreductase [Cellulophaga sp. 20_2_10]